MVAGSGQSTGLVQVTELFFTFNHFYNNKKLRKILEFFFRFAQCFRRFRDTRHAFPHLVNAGKYSTTLVANLFEFLSNVTFGFARQGLQNYVGFCCRQNQTIKDKWYSEPCCSLGLTA